MRHRGQQNFFIHYVHKRKLLHLATTTQYDNDSLTCSKIIHNIRKSISSSNEVGTKYIFKNCKLICQPNTLQNHVTQTANKYTKKMAKFKCLETGPTKLKLHSHKRIQEVCAKIQFETAHTIL
jgi:hypothetical protein